MADKITQKVSSNGQKWTERLAGVTTMTKYHAYSIVESGRIERGKRGYQKRGPLSGSYIL